MWVLINSNINWNNQILLLDWFSVTEQSFETYITNMNQVKKCSGMIVELSPYKNGTNLITIHIPVNYLLNNMDNSIIVYADPLFTYVWKIRYNSNTKNIQVWAQTQVASCSLINIRIYGIM